MFRNKGSLRGKTAIVTGAARGLGFALAEQLSAEGADLVLVDIDREGLDRARTQISPATTLTHPMDVGQWPEWGGLRDRLEAESRTVDILINNAGVVYGGRFVSTNLDGWHRVIGVNLWGVIYGCYAFLPHMYENGSGRIVNVASMSGLVSTGASTPYSTSKFGVVGLSEGLRAEAAVQGVSVTVACPGFVRTGIADGAVDDSIDVHDHFQTELRRAIERHGIQASVAARRIVRGMMKDRAIILITTRSRLVYGMRRWMPWTWDRLCRWIARREARAMQRWRTEHPERASGPDDRP